MKYLKTFEDSYSRDIEYKYLDRHDTNTVRTFVNKYIDNLDIENKLSKLTIKEYEKNSFDYIDILVDIYKMNIYQPGNIYYDVDVFCDQNVINRVPAPALRNSLQNIIYEKINPIFDKNIIELLEKNPKHYIKKYDNWSMFLNKNVKNSCEWMFNAEKYNLL